MKYVKNKDFLLLCIKKNEFDIFIVTNIYTEHQNITAVVIFNICIKTNIFSGLIFRLTRVA